MKPRRLVILAALTTLTPVTCWAQDASNKIVTSEHTYALTKVADGLENPWGLDWLPNKQILVTERAGRMRIVSPDGKVSEPLTGLPEITSESRDGLLDVAVSPAFAKDKAIFFAYSKKDGKSRWLEVASAHLEGSALKDVKTIFSSGVKVEKDQGFGSRIRFDRDGNLVISVGDHAAKDNAQNPSNALGSIIRIKPDGTPANKNPGGKLHPAIFAYGFKNPQGLTIDPKGNIWAVDHGGMGGDEINRVEKGKNYGWPTRAFGGGNAPGAEKGGDFVEPFFTWGASPVMAPSGLEIYTGKDFPNWTGDLFTGSLTQGTLVRVMLSKSGSVIGTENIIDTKLGRIREVRQGPDGHLYVLNDESKGGIYRIDPVK